MDWRLLRHLHVDDLCEPQTYRGKVVGSCRVRSPELWRKLLLDETNDKTMLTDTTRKIWLWSDLHFGHKNIIHYSDRPFNDIDSMREALIRNYNELVHPDDICIWVGDVAFLDDYEANQILYRLVGKRILIIGNHDLHKNQVKKLKFDEIRSLIALEYKGVRFVLTHYPMRNLPDDTIINIHGHEHAGGNENTQSPQHFNVNCEFHDYKPITLDSIVAHVTKNAV
jgi:calcineurin-like phosphoesterase family protein